jgi:hypothetical protein
MHRVGSLTHLSLRSFGRHSASNKFCNVEKKFIKTLHYNVDGSLKNKTELFKIEEALRISKQQKAAIRYILTTWRNKSRSLTIDKYMHKFAYRYQKHYNQNSQIIRKKKKYSVIHESSIIQIYTVYKILQTKNKFTAFKKLS